MSTLRQWFWQSFKYLNPEISNVEGQEEELPELVQSPKDEEHYYQGQGRL